MSNINKLVYEALIQENGLPIIGDIGNAAKKTITFLANIKKPTTIPSSQEVGDWEKDNVSAFQAHQNLKNLESIGKRNSPQNIAAGKGTPAANTIGNIYIRSNDVEGSTQPGKGFGHTSSFIEDKTGKSIETRQKEASNQSKPSFPTKEQTQNTEITGNSNDGMTTTKDII